MDRTTGFRINSGGSAPEINLKQGATNIADGGSYDFGPRLQIHDRES